MPTKKYSHNELLKREIKNRIKITDVLSTVFGVKNAVAGGVVRCPIPGHDDKNPSFLIYKNNVNCKCYSCPTGAGDIMDIFGLVQKAKGIGFVDALKDLSDTFNIKIDTEARVQKYTKDIQGYARKMKPELLSDRGITPEIIKKMKIGLNLYNGVEYLVFPYFKTDGTLKRIRYISVQKNNRGKSEIRTVNMTTDKVSYFYNAQSLQKYKKSKPLFVAEGEKDTLCLISHGFQAVGLATATGYNGKKQSHLLRGFDVILLLDNDETGFAGLKKICNSNLKDEAKSVRIGRIGDIEALKEIQGADICDVYKYDPANFSANIQKIIDMSTTAIIDMPISESEIIGIDMPINTKDGVNDMPINTESQDNDNDIEDIAPVLKKNKEKIKGYRVHILGIELNSKLAKTEKERAISHYIYNELAKEGTFYYTENEDFYYFSTAELSLYDMTGSRFGRFLNFLFGINESKGIYNYTIKNLITQNEREGRLTEVYDTVYYNQTTNTVYLHDNNAGVFKITKDAVTKENNGIDGVLFLKDCKKAPINIDLDKPLSDDERSEFLDIIFENPNYKDCHELLATISINKEDRKKMFSYWFFSLFFPEFFDTKPILTIVGEKGSGKTLSLKLIRELFYGKNKRNLIQLSEKKEDSENHVINNYLVFIDNFDKKATGRMSYALDWLAGLATGEEISKRKLYENGVNVSYVPRCYTAITSRTPDFRRDDIAERLIIIDVEKIPKYLTENSIHKNLLQNRANIWLAVVLELQDILKAIQGGFKENAQHRMGEYAVFIDTIETYRGSPAYAEKIFGKVKNRQAVFTLKDDPIYEALTELIDDTGKFYGNASKLCISLHELNPAVTDNTRSFAQKFNAIRYELSTIFNIVETQPKNKKMYKITK